MKNFSIRQIPLRRRTLEQVNKDQQFAQLYGALAPEVFCPEKVRIGTIGDGGKWVCNPWKVPNDSDEQTEATRKVYSEIRGVSKKALISMTTSQKNQTSTIEDLAKDAGVTKVEILKIDIEGAEKTCLIPFLEKFTVCQIYLEVHGGAQEHVKLLQEIAHLNYRLFSYEVNGFGMTACEYSFIHETCIEKYGGRRIAYFLDYLN
uniref:Methyltransf_21 domain-containing protein n=1 Tax=Caenorhabditis japonica TaxID=281687 RepID=A0A8R1HUE0_CAEJA